MNRPNNRSILARRHLLAGLAGATLAPLAPWSHAQAGRQPTPAQTLGPFYPRDASERPRATDADLIVVEGTSVRTKGVPLFLTGRVLDRAGRPVPSASVEIWQCDAMSVYHHPAGGAQAERDPNFQGYGADRSDADGIFRFRTIVPVAYPGRTPHIHIRLQPAGGAALATQLYLANDPGNASDFLFRRLSAAEQQALLLKIEPTGDTTHPLARLTRFTARTELVLA
jgi:protocatechuate 3,4-dioxygenase beta subunit